MRSRQYARSLALVAMATASSWVGCGGGGSDLSGPATGSLAVTTATSGPEPDADGYTVSLDGGAAQAIIANGAWSAEGLSSGSHAVTLAGIAANCSVTEGAGLTVQVVAGETTAVRFTVACAATSGALEVVATSTGAPADPDGYLIQLDGADGQAIVAGATVAMPGLSPGTHTVGLTGLAPNCTVDGDNPRSVSVTTGVTARVALAVSCSAVTPPPAPGGIAVTTQITGPDPDPDGYALSLDGAAAGTIGAAATETMAGLAPGSHTVGLAGLSGNCSLAGDNPRAVTVAAGTVAPVTFAVTCTALPPATGSVTITTGTTGESLDPDGYAFVIDGGNAQPIGLEATVRLDGLVAGDHTVRLRGASANCTIAGDNPRTVTVASGASTTVAFTVACVAATGALQVTTATSGPSPDPDGYSLSLDGGAATAIGTSAGASFAGLSPGAHTLLLGGIAANCRPDGQNPRPVTITGGETATEAFSVTCAATTGSLAVTVSGLPAGASAAVTVTGPGNFTAPVTATASLTGLAPGGYTVAAADVSSGGSQYVAAPASATVTVTAGATATAAVSYGPATGPSLNLRIDGWFLTQSVQTTAADVPLIEDRQGFLRVFVVADQANTARPAVRVRLFRNGTLAQTIDIPAPGPSVPLSRDEPTLSSSWNVEIPRALFGPGLTVVAEVDPANAIAEKNEGDNSYPATGTPQAAPTRAVPPLTVRFVPVRQQVSGLTGDVTASNKSRFLDLPRRMYPISTADGDVHAVYTTTTPDPLVSDDANAAWETILSEVNALRIAEGSDRSYYGVVKIGYQSGVAGLGYLGLPAAIGYDVEGDRSRVMAHELGHTFDRQHAPCGGPGGVDAGYPYAGGLTGAYGYDLQDDVLKSPFLADIMGYCANPWISDYTYDGVVAFRTAQAAAQARTAAAPAQRCLLVWGRIVDGRPVLEPAFEIVARPSLPSRPGPYTVEAVGDGGIRLLALSFDASPVEDGRRDARQFAFAVPLGAMAAERVAGLRLAGPGGGVSAVKAPMPIGAALTGPVVEARLAPGGVALRWDATAHPMVMVRDPETGEIVSFARGGQATIGTARRTLEVVVSDRVGSRTERVTVSP
jgi:hypothetical protein